VEAFTGIGVASFAGLTVFDIAPMTATKAIAAAEEMTSKGCRAEATVVFGDMPNAQPLFGSAG
jgi:hypothetical protein